MTTEIRAWQIVDGGLRPVDSSMILEGRREVDHLQHWIKTRPEILGGNLTIIGEQVPTRSGFIDFLAIDRNGNLVIIELKRDRLPRDVLAQAIDYASDVGGWDAEKLNEVTSKLTGQSIQDFLIENFQDIDPTDLVINKVQRILLVGFAIEESLERMIEWLSNTYGVSVNAIILKYMKTISGDELIARTMIIPEAVDQARASHSQIKIEMSDEPGNYDPEELRQLLISYLSEARVTPRRIREILLPLGLQHQQVPRELIIQELVKRGDAEDEGKAGTILTTISREIGIAKRDYLRQVIQYDRPNPWEKDNYRIVEEYKPMVGDLLASALAAGDRLPEG